jgi:hypothetical protein
MPRPADLPGWAPANPADIVTPSGAKKLQGFQGSEIPPYGWFNWFWSAVSLWLEYLDTAYDTEHNEDGTHDVINPRRIDYSGNPDLPGYREVVIPLGSPATDGAWRLTSGTETIAPTGSPPNAYSGAAAVAVAWARSLDMLIKGGDDAVAGDQWTISLVQANYHTVGAGHHFTAAIKSIDRMSAAVAATTEDSATTNGGALSQQTFGGGDDFVTSIAIDPSKHYWIEVTCTPNGTAANAAIADVAITVQRKRLE